MILTLEELETSKKDFLSTLVNIMWKILLKKSLYKKSDEYTFYSNDFGKNIQISYTNCDLGVVKCSIVIHNMSGEKAFTITFSLAKYERKITVCISSYHFTYKIEHYDLIHTLRVIRKKVAKNSRNELII